MAVLNATFGNDKNRLNLMYAPQYKDSPATLMMNYGVRFK